jgi:hypothetical protein
MPDTKGFSLGGLSGIIGGFVIAALIPIAFSWFSERQVEVSFDKLDHIQPSNPGSFFKLLDLVGFDLEKNPARSFRVYAGENDNGVTKLRASQLQYRHYYFSRKIRGSLTERDGTVFSVLGFYNDERLVFVHRGPVSGVGTYIVQRFEHADPPGQYFSGYAIFEDQRRETAPDKWITQCPFIMMEEDLAAKKYPTAEKAKERYSFLGSNCVEFKLPPVSRR